jgi:hypothetical protein
MAGIDSKTYVVRDGKKVRAKMADHEIDLIRELAEDEVDPITGKLIRKGLSYREIAEKFENAPR